MTNQFDVAIIGGGPGGSTSAIFLRKAGYRVLLLEKEKFPRDHVGESLIPFCYYKLKEMGALEDVLTFATKKPGVNFSDRDGKRQSVWCFNKVIQDGAEMSMHCLRAPFDHALLKQAAKLGADVREQHTVKHADLSSPDCVKIEALNEKGETIEFEARFLIDASGQQSFLSRHMNSRVPFEGLDRTAFFTHWTGTRYDESLRSGLIKIIYVGGEKKGWIWVIPVGRNHLSIGVTMNNEYLRSKKEHYRGPNWKEHFYRAELSEALALQPILEGATIEHEVQVISDYSYSVEKKYGANFALVGDSGSFLDPIFSSGIYVAMEVAERVSKALNIKFKEGNANGEEAFRKTFAEIEKGYVLIEKFVRLFYDPELLRFTDLGSGDDGYNRFLSAYEIFHYLLAGDFFTDTEKYMGFIDDLNKQRTYNQFIHYVKTKADEFPAHEFCRYTFEEVYGHLPEGDTVAPGLLKKQHQ